MNATCTYFPLCKGCDSWDRSYSDQALIKKTRLQKILNLSTDFLNSSVHFVSVQPYGLRHRFDFTLQDGVMGFYGGDRNLLDIEVCLQLSNELQTVYEAFRQVAPSEIQKGSVRLRVGPTGLWGCWLDLANIDVKNLLDETHSLNKILGAGFEVEIGQKGKRLSLIENKLKLTDPVMKDWFRTQSVNRQVMTLKSLISDFTQPSWISAEAMTRILMDWIKDRDVRNALEFGPGIGQFTLPLLSAGVSVQTYENNLKAVAALELNALAHDLQNNLEVNVGDFQSKAIASTPDRPDLVLVNPPRSGLKNFVNTVIATQAKICIYISCFPESMAVDLHAIQASGYKIKEIQIVDQFPQTSHFETCVLLEKN